MENTREIRREFLKIEGGEIPIILAKDKDEQGEFYFIAIDNVEWVTTENKTHAIVLFELMKDHITNYMTYKRI